MHITALPPPVCTAADSPSHPSPPPPLPRQVIKGSDSPLARAAAAGKPTQHLRAAAAADLDTLQQLAVTEKTLAGWVSALSPRRASTCLAAAACCA